MTPKQKRIFFNWLQKQNALKAYKQARYQQKRMSQFDSYEEMTFYDPLSWSFNWRKTSEGPAFWRVLSFKWCEYFWSLRYK